jgi:peptide/nickel transport system permease protein
VTAPTSLLPYAVSRSERAEGSFWKRVVRERQARFGLLTTGLVALFALVGPLFAESPTALTGPIYGAPAAGHGLGFDYLGHDVLARVLAGGASLLSMSIATAVLAWLVGISIGLIAGYSNRFWDQVVVWCADAFHAFPNLILVLLVVSMLGRDRWLIVLTAASSLVPGVVRLSRGLTQQVARREFVEAAELLGYSRWRIRVGEILPNILSPLLVHLGTMLSWAVSILSGLAFLGYGVAPPAADWGLMINENRAGLPIQPWAVIVPALLVALLALGTNVLAESIGRVSNRIEEQ